MSDQHRGIKEMRKPPDAVVVVDAQYEDTAIKEASSMGIPVVAIVDSNTDPDKVNFPIPANDDSLRTIQLLMGSIADAILDIKGSTKDRKEPEKVIFDNKPNDLENSQLDEEE